MAATAEQSSARNIWHDSFLCAAGFDVAGPIGESDDSPCVAYIDELWVWAGGVESDAERSVEARDKDLIDVRMVRAIRSAQDSYPSRTAFSDKDVTVGGSANETRIIKSRKELVNFETGADAGPCLRRSTDEPRTAVDGSGGVRFWQVCGREMVTHPRGI
jgi:hypothetical protein